jgi:hypothetical protein
MSDSPDRRLRQIEWGLEATRTNIDKTLRAIQRRLSAEALIDQGIDYFRHSSGRQFVSNLGASAIENPMPVAVAGIGLAWLMAAGQHSGDGGHHKAADASGLSHMGGKIRETAGAAAKTISEGSSQAVQRAREIAEHSSGYVRRTGKGVQAMVEEQPLVLGVLGLAIGAVVYASGRRIRKGPDANENQSLSVEEGTVRPGPEAGTAQSGARTENLRPL